ncbi:MAG: HigA family addiction module antitoxin [Dongiaceae bacterium]
MSKELPVTRRPNRLPTHPGIMLRDDILPALDLSVTEAASQLGVSRQNLHRLLAGEIAVTPEMALRLGKFCGNGPELWLGMQQAYDLRRAAQALSSELARIPSHKVEAA